MPIERVAVQLYLVSRWSGWLTLRSGRFTPRERHPVPIVQYPGWYPGPVWKGAEDLAPTGIRSPDCLALASYCTDYWDAYIYKGKAVP